MQYKHFKSQVSSIGEEDISFKDAVSKLRDALSRIAAAHHLKLEEHSSQLLKENSFTLVDPEESLWLNRTVSVYMNQEENQIRIGKLPSNEAFNPKEFKKVIRWLELYYDAKIDLLEKRLKIVEENSQLNQKSVKIAVSGLKVLSNMVSKKTGRRVQYEPEKNVSTVKIYDSEAFHYSLLVSLDRVGTNTSELMKVLSCPEEIEDGLFPCILEMN